MPSQPGLTDVHVDRPLTNISIAFAQGAEDFVASRAMRNIPVSFKSDLYYTIPRGAWARDEMQLRAPATESAGSGYDVANDNYNCDVWALHKDVADQVRRNYDNPLDPDREATEFLMDKGFIRREKQWASTFFQPAVWTTDIDGVAAAPGAGEVLQWNDASSTPIEDVRANRQEIKRLTGREGNVLVMGREVWDTLLDHPDIIDRVKYGQTAGRPAQADRNILAQLFEVEEILVMNASENTAAEGATPAYGFIGGKSALLVHRPASPGLMTPAAGYVFSWTGLAPGFAGDEGQVMGRMRLDTRKADRIEIEMAFDMKVVAADLGAFWDTIIA